MHWAPGSRQAERTMAGNAPSDSFPYPRGSVVGILTDEATFEDARERLSQSGFGADRCQVLHGEEGLARIDVDGEAHGRGGTVIGAPRAGARRDSRDTA